MSTRAGRCARTTRSVPRTRAAVMIAVLRPTVILRRIGHRLARLRRRCRGCGELTSVPSAVSSEVAGGRASCSSSGGELMVSVSASGKSGAGRGCSCAARCLRAAQGRRGDGTLRCRLPGGTCSQSCWEGEVRPCGDAGTGRLHRWPRGPRRCRRRADRWNRSAPAACWWRRSGGSRCWPGRCCRRWRE